MFIPILVCHVLIVLEDRIEGFEAFRGQETDRANEIGNGSCSKGAARETNEYDVIAVNIIGTNKVVAFADVLIPRVSEI